MSSSSDGEEAEQFFETMEDIASTSASESSEGEIWRSRQRTQQLDPFSDPKYAVWTSDLLSIGERRLRLFQRLGLETSGRPAALERTSYSFPLSSLSPGVARSISDPVEGEKFGHFLGQELGIVEAVSSAEQRNGFVEGGRKELRVFSSSDSHNSSGAAEEGSREENFEEHVSADSSSREFVCRIKDLDNGKEFIVHELGSDGLWNRLREVGTGKEFSLEEFESSLGLSPLVKGQRDVASGKAKQKRKSWLRQIRGVVKRRPAEITKEGSSDNLLGSGTKSPWRMQRIKVRVSKKVVRELTELYMGQEIQAHQGPIWALKFSSGGRYLSSGGQDCIVRVWEVVTQESAEANLSSPRATLKRRNSSSRKRHGLDERPVLKTFGLEPIGSLRGHTEDILDLSWSASEQFLLSSSMDTTVRLWHVPREECLRIFSHNDYVTCVVFNPVDERFFLSGSLDGKVRIWSILDHHVIDWTDLREIVTAASYTPDGTAAIIGTYKGICRFYATAGNKLQPDGHIDVVGKKGRKYRGKKVTGIQCMPGDPSKVLITSNDSRIRLYDGNELISKYKGFRNMSSQISASFSRNGSFIISASEDSHVYMWNVLPRSTASCRGHLKISDRSCENFFSDNVTVAVPWSTHAEAQNKGSSQEHRKDDSRGLKVGGDILQLLKQTSFPGPCFDCLTIAGSGDGTSVFPVSDDTDSVADSLSVDVVSSPASLTGLFPSTKFADKNLEAPPVVLDLATQKEAAVPASFGLVIVTASLSGEIRTFQNYGLPLQT